MAYDFPNSPAEGQIYSPGPTWTFSHGAWVKIVETDPALSGAQFFTSYLQAQSSPIAIEHEVIFLNGYYNPGDGGAATYKRVTTQPTHIGGRLQSGDGSWWQLVETTVTLEMFGATGLDMSLDGTALINAIGYLNVKGGGTIRCMGGRVYHFHLTGVTGGGMPINVPVCIDLNGATWKRPDGVMTAGLQWYRMLVFALRTTKATLEIGNGTIDANYTNNDDWVPAPSPPAIPESQQLEHSNSIFVWSYVLNAQSVYFHDLKLLDRWNFDHIGLYADEFTSLNRATFSRITSETSQAFTFRSDIIWSRHCRSIHIDNCKVHHIESEIQGVVTLGTDIFINNSTAIGMLDCAGTNTAIGINGYNVYCTNVTAARSNFIRVNLFDENCDFGDVQGMSPGKWRSKDSKFLVRDTGFPTASASTNTGQYVPLDWYLIRPKFRLLAGPQTITNPAFGFPAWQTDIHQQYYITLEEPDFLDDFGIGGTPNGHVRIIRPKIRVLGIRVWIVSGTADRLVDTTLDSGDYSQCVGPPIYFSSFVTAGYKLTLLGDWHGIDGRWATTGTGHSPALVENHRRIYHTAKPDSAIIGDILHIQPVPTSGPITYVAGPSLTTAQTWRPGICAVAKAATGSRPALTVTDIGVMHLDTTLDADGKPIWWTGTAWVDATGAVV